MSLLYEKILKTIEAHQMFTAADRVAVAVSGGPDSLALLILLQRLASRFSLELMVAHFNHQLRGEESEKDERFVRDRAIDLGLRCVVGSEDVRRHARQERMNEELAARECRYRFLRTLADSNQVTRVALGHTANDQAETFLMRLVRGAGTRGLGSIYPVIDRYFVRPLLDVTREEVEHFLKAEGLVWREDSSNTDLRRTRNRIRHELLPHLAGKYNPGIVRKLAQTATQCRQDDRFLSELAKEWFERHQLPIDRTEVEAVPGVAIPIDPLASQEEAIQSRVIRLAIESTRGDLLRTREEHVEAIRRLVSVGQSGDSADLPRHVRVERVFEQLVFSAAGGADHPNYELPMPVPGHVKLPFRGLIWRSRLLDRTLWVRDVDEKVSQESSESNKDSRHPANVAYLDYAKISLCLKTDGSGKLVVRNVRPGDRYQPRGSDHVMKIHDLLSARRIAASGRRGWPLLMAGQEVVWARGCAESKEAAATSQSREILMIDEVLESGE